LDEEAGRFHVVYENDPLGGYARPEQAAEAVAGGYMFLIPSGIDTSTLGIPEELNKWQRV
jgi:hypothetical protein